jgi:alpha-D-ribose 1-methylphosphonate 5-triphosphate diphosphatase
MDHTLGQGQYKDIDRYLNFMQKWLGTDLDSLGEHKERIIAKMKENIAAAAARTRDWDVVADVLRVAAEYGVPVASHDDDTVEKVARQAALGASMSEFPVTKETAHAAREQGMKIIMGAPNAYRGESTSNNLSAMDAIHDGLVDILATDYYPSAILHTTFKLARDGVMPLYRSIRLASTNAADVMGMTDRGRIAVGCRADLVLVHENGLFPRVRGTIRQGIPIYWDSHLANLSQLSRLFAIEERIC